MGIKDFSVLFLHLRLCPLFWIYIIGQTGNSISLTTFWHISDITHRPKILWHNSHHIGPTCTIKIPRCSALQCNFQQIYVQIFPIAHGPLYKWTEHFILFYFWNYKVGVKRIFEFSRTWARPFFDEFQILAAWSVAQKKYITEFTEFQEFSTQVRKMSNLYEKKSLGVSINGLLYIKKSMIYPDFFFWIYTSIHIHNPIVQGILLKICSELLDFKKRTTKINANSYFWGKFIVILGSKFKNENTSGSIAAAMNCKS